jgi:hypothetical protein
MLSKQGLDIHIQVFTLWNYREDISAVVGEQLQHLKGCQLCIRTLGLCCMGTSFRHATELVTDAF